VTEVRRVRQVRLARRIAAVVHIDLEAAAVRHSLADLGEVVRRNLADPVVVVRPVTNK